MRSVTLYMFRPIELRVRDYMYLFNVFTYTSIYIFNEALTNYDEIECKIYIKRHIKEVNHAALKFTFCNSR